MNLKWKNKNIYYKGDISLIHSKRNIAVIGSRKVSDKGIKLAFDTGYELAKMGLNVVNGLALGCDTFALKGALATGGKCIAVMPCGLDQVVPRYNLRLADEILDKGGCLISEYPVGTRVEKYMYIERDMIQAQISFCVIVIEADINSGTMHTVRAASRQGKNIACYRIAKMADSGHCHIIDDLHDLGAFVEGEYDKPEFWQMDISEFAI